MKYEMIDVAALWKQVEEQHAQGKIVSEYGSTQKFGQWTSTSYSENGEVIETPKCTCGQPKCQVIGSESLAWVCTNPSCESP